MKIVNVLVLRIAGLLTYEWHIRNNVNCLCKMEMYVSKVTARGSASLLSDVSRTEKLLEL